SGSPFCAVTAQHYLRNKHCARAIAKGVLCELGIPGRSLCTSAWDRRRLALSGTGAAGGCVRGRRDEGVAVSYDEVMKQHHLEHELKRRQVQRAANDRFAWKMTIDRKSVV